MEAPYAESETALSSTLKVFGLKVMFRLPDSELDFKTSCQSEPGWNIVENPCQLKKGSSQSEQECGRKFHPPEQIRKTGPRLE